MSHLTYDKVGLVICRRHPCWKIPGRVLECRVSTAAKSAAYIAPKTGTGANPLHYSWNICLTSANNTRDVAILGNNLDFSRGYSTPLLF